MKRYCDNEQCALCDLMDKYNAHNKPFVACPHQWFEVKKLVRHDASKCDGTGMMHDSASCFAGRVGLLVKCANCLTSKELWE